MAIFRPFLPRPADERDLRMLSEVLFWERTQIGTSQRGLARMIGFTQQKLSAYETGRVTPSWRTFVRLLASMDLRPVLETEPMPRPDSGLDNPKELLRPTPTRWCRGACW